MSNQACSSGKQRITKIPNNGSKNTQVNRSRSPGLKGNTSGKLQNTTNEVDLSSPGLCAALHIASEIKTATEKEKKARLLYNKHLQTISNKKANQKVNIPFTEHVFTNLVDLNINNEVISSGQNPMKILNLTKKDDGFDLSLFYKCDFSTECLIKYSVATQEIEKVEHYNGLDIYKRMESLPIYYNF